MTVGIDVGLFKYLAKSEGVQNANDLAKTLGMDPPLLCMFVLCPYRKSIQASINRYSADMLDSSRPSYASSRCYGVRH